MLRDLGGGLILRRATLADADALIAFNCDVHCSNGTERKPMELWIRDLMSGDHPTFGPSDFTVVQDTNTGAVVSSLCLISQTWSYRGVKFGVGVPELVGTRPGYRRRGLVRAQFEVVHGWSARRRHKAQAVGGIPDFYRQFGYEMALEMEGGRLGLKSEAPKLKRGDTEPYRVRAATEGDLSFIGRVYREGMKRYLVSCVRSGSLWRYELKGRRRKAIERRELRVIESTSGDRVGFLVHKAVPWPRANSFGVEVYELKTGVSWLAVTPSVVRYLVTTGGRHVARTKKELTYFAFWLGSEHPVYDVMPDALVRTRDPYAFYVRVPDLPGFLRHMSPVLEQRVANSVIAGYTGELKLNFYRAGLRLVFQRGRLTHVGPWTPAEGQSAAFPDLTFLHLLFGHRSLEELRLSYRDCFATGDEARLLLAVLFPKMPSAVWPVS